MVVGDGFEPSKGRAQLIYSQSPLATWVTYREGAGKLGNDVGFAKRFLGGISAGVRSPPLAVGAKDLTLALGAGRKSPLRLLRCGRPETARERFLSPA